MIQTKYNGNFGLDEIEKIILRNSIVSKFYEIRFLNSKRKLFCSELHCFLTESKVAVSTKDLKIGDKIWVDISAFSADMSLK